MLASDAARRLYLQFKVAAMSATCLLGLKFPTVKTD